jgi:hypothetical protein
VPLDARLDPLGLPEPPLSDAEPLSAEALPLFDPLFDPLLPAALPLPTDVPPLDADPLDGALPEDGDPDPAVELASEPTATWPPSVPEQPEKARAAAIEPARRVAREDRSARRRPSFTFASGSRRQCIGANSMPARRSIDRARREERASPPLRAMVPKFYHPNGVIRIHKRGAASASGGVAGASSGERAIACARRGEG